MLETISLLCLLLPVFGLIVVANVLVRRAEPTEQLIFQIFLFFINLPLFFIGIFFIWAANSVDFSQTFEQFGFTITNLGQIGLVTLLMAGWGMLVTLGPVRRLLAKIMPIDPSSSVHTLALVFSGYLIGQGALTLTQDGLEGLAESSVPVTIWVLLATGLMLIILAFLGVGFLIRRSGRPFMERMGLTRPSLVELVIAGVIIVGLVILQAVAGAVWALFNPNQAALVEDVNTLLLTDLDTLWEWFLLALASGVGEELLFRGAIQPVFGIGFTSVLFALLHIQYGFTPIILVILVLAVVLGLVRRYFSTTISIIVHVGYNFVLGIIALIATYVVQAAG